MSVLEFQDDEREALLSIYEGDPAFKQLSPTIFQYKYGEEDNIRSFLLEIVWGNNYPMEKPEINMDTFYNKHVNQTIKSKVVELISNEAEQYLGMSMTYSLFELIKEKFDELIEEQNNEAIEVTDDVKDLSINEPLEELKKKTPKKEHLTKAQKRRQWNKVGEKGERPRGWNWMDLVKHLSQTGSKEDQVSSSTS